MGGVWQQIGFCHGKFVHVPNAHDGKHDPKLEIVCVLNSVTGPYFVVEKSQ